MISIRNPYINPPPTPTQKPEASLPLRKTLHKPPTPSPRSKPSTTIMAFSVPINLLLIIILAPLLSANATNLLLPLTHTHSQTHSPAHHLLKSSSARSSARFHTRQRSGTHHRNNQQQVSVPLGSGSDYTLSLSVGPSATPINLFMDTGSDLVWFPCSPFRCILCEGKSPPLPSPPPPNSSLVSCADPACSAVHSATSSSDLCSMANCPLEDIETSSCRRSHHCPQFYYAYGDGSLIANLRRGPLSLNSLSVPNFTFACAHNALAEPVGVAGFGRGILSLPSQLSPSLGSRFSYCLLSHFFNKDKLIKPSPLILGRSNPAQEQPQFTYTPMLLNPKYPYFYSVSLAAVSVGPTRIPTDSSMTRVDGDGNGGLVVDSGTTFTMLPSGLYTKLTDEFAAKMGRAGFKRSVKAEGETGLGPCYYYDGRNDSRAVPGLGLHFAGNATVWLPRRNYFMGFESKGGERVGCMMVMNGGDLTEEGAGGPAGTLGNFQQQGFEVVYDLEEGRVGFARRRCAALWDEMARG